MSDTAFVLWCVVLLIVWGLTKPFTPPDTPPTTDDLQRRQAEIDQDRNTEVM